MTNTATGVVVTPVKDAFLVSELVRQSLNQLITAERQIVDPNSALLEHFQLCETRLLPDAELVELAFTFLGERRHLHLHFNCDEDHADLGAQSILLSMFSPKDAELFLSAALHALSILGPVYIALEDTAPVPLEETALTVMDLLRFGYWPRLRLDKWLAAFEKKLIGEGKFFEQFFGIGEMQLKCALAKASIKDVDTAIEELVKATPVVTPRFMLEYHQRAAA